MVALLYAMFSLWLNTHKQSPKAKDKLRLSFAHWGLMSCIAFDL
jgi:hypothetical protein